MVECYTIFVRFYQPNVDFISFRFSEKLPFFFCFSVRWILFAIRLYGGWGDGEFFYGFTGPHSIDETFSFHTNGNIKKTTPNNCLSVGSCSNRKRKQFPCKMRNILSNIFFFFHFCSFSMPSTVCRMDMMPILFCLLCLF